MSLWRSERRASRSFFLLYALSLLAFWLLPDSGYGGARVALGLVLFLLAPGFIPALLLKKRLGVGFLETLPLAVSFSMGQGALVLAVFDRLPLSLLDSSWVLVAVTLLWCAWSELVSRRDSSAGFETLPGGRPGSGSRFLSLALLLVVVFTAVMLLKVGAPMRWQADSAAHMAAIRGVVEEDRLSPSQQPYGGNGPVGPDPRFGIFHGLAAVLATSSGVEVYRLWAVLPAFFGPVLVLAFLFAARGITGSVKVAFAAALLFPLCYGGIEGEALRNAGYPNRVSMAVYLVCLGVAFKYLRGEGRWLLGLLGVLMASAAAIHVYHFIEFMFVITCFAALLLIVRRDGRAGVLKDYLRVAGVAVGVSLPLLLYRFFTSYSTANIYNVEGQGILFLDGFLYILNPFPPYAWLGFAGVASLLLLPYFFSRARQSDAHAFVAAATSGPLLLVFNPLLMPLASKVLSYLASRLIWAVPYSLSIGMFLVELPANVGLASPRRKALYVALSAVIVVALAGTLSHRVSSYGTYVTRQEAGFPEDMTAVSGVVGKFDGLAQGRRVFLSDPITAYAIPAFSGHYVTAIPVAHSSPADPTPVSRIRDAMDVLNPGVGLGRTASILGEYGVDFVVVNTLFAERLFAFEYEIDPAFQRGALQKMTSAEGLFQEVFSEEGLHVFKVLGTHLAEQVEDPVPSELVAGASSPAAQEIAEFADRFALLEVNVKPGWVQPGDSLDIGLLWSCASPAAEEDVYKLFVRLETPFPEGRFFREFYEKPYRKILESRLGKKFRFRSDIDPERSGYPLHLWTSGDVVRQVVRVAVPEDAFAGTYSVKVNLRRTTPGTNYRLSDYLRDEDYYSGVEVGSVLIGVDRPGEAD